MLFLIQKFTAVSASLLRKYCALCIHFSSKVVFSLPRKLFPTFFLPQVSLFSPDTSCLLFIDKRQPQSQEGPHHRPHAYSPVCGHPHVFLPTCCPARAAPPGGPDILSPFTLSETFLVFPSHLSLGSFPSVYKHALVQCCPWNFPH